MEKQQRVAHETLSFFVPLAARLGLSQAEEELTARCSKVLKSSPLPEVVQAEAIAYFSSEGFSGAAALACVVSSEEGAVLTAGEEACVFSVVTV